MNQIPLLIEEKIKWYLHELPLIKFRQKYSLHLKQNKKLRPKQYSGYIFFGRHWIENLNDQNLQGAQAMKAIGKTWNKLTTKEKESYNQIAREFSQKEKALFIRAFPDCQWTKEYLLKNSLDSIN